MMRITILIYSLLLSCSSISQSFEGEWKGAFETLSYNSSTKSSFFSNDHNLIRLRFTLNKDSSYTVYSFSDERITNGAKITVIAQLSGRVYKDSLYLEEVAIIGPKDLPRQCPQKMFLKRKVRKKITELRGIWVSNSDDCDYSGTIYFWQRNKK